LRCARLCISLAASNPTVDLRRTSGLMAPRIGKVSSSMKSLFQFFWLGTCGRKVRLEISILTRRSVPRRLTLSATAQSQSLSDGKKTADITIYLGGQHCRPDL